MRYMRYLADEALGVGCQSAGPRDLVPDSARRDTIERFVDQLITELG